MGELILCILEPPFELLMEFLLDVFCHCLSWIWSSISSLLSRWM